jgi:hypothetical protein
LNINLNINNETQGCKIGTVLWEGDTSGRGRGNEGDEGEGYG